MAINSYHFYGNAMQLFKDRQTALRLVSYSSLQLGESLIQRPESYWHILISETTCRKCSIYRTIPTTTAISKYAIKILAIQVLFQQYDMQSWVISCFFSFSCLFNTMGGALLDLSLHINYVESWGPYQLFINNVE